MARRLVLIMLLLLCAGVGSAAAQDDQLLSGSITGANPTAEFTIQLNEGDSITITTEALDSDLDTTLTLLDPRGDEVAYNDDIDLAGGNYNSQIEYEAERSGEYIIVVGSFTGTGDFELTISFGGGAPPRGGGGSASGSVEVGFTDVFEGTIQDPSETVDFDLDLQAGDTVILQTQGLTGDLDTILTLYGTNGREISTVDDANLDGGNVNSVIIYEVDDSGTYTATVGAYGGTGDFSLSVTTLNPADVNSQVVQGELTSRELSASYELELVEGDSIVIQTQSLSGDLDTMLTLYNPSGDIAYENDDINTDAGNYNSAISFTVDETGTYTLEITGYNESTGEYLVTVSTGVVSSTGVGPVEIGAAEETQRGEITSGNPEVEFPFTLEAGETALIQTEALDSSLDTTLSILDPSGDEIAYNDDFQSESYDSGLVFTAEESGEYTAVVSSYGSSTGRFSLAITVGGEELVQQLDNMKRVELSGPALTRETENFVIHYTLEGDDATTEEYVDAAAEYADNVWNIQINEMGWAAPPGDQGAGGDDRFDIYLVNIFNEDAGCLYGYASSEPGVGNGDNPNTAAEERYAYTSYLVVDNDYDRDNPVGGSCGGDERALPDLHTTIAHEFNHNIQFGYDAAEPHNWMFEAIASWIEVYVAADDEAATIYVADNYAYPEVCFGSKDGTLIYGHWMFLQSLVDMHGVDIVREIWENAVDYDGFEALAVTLEAHGDSIEAATLRYAALNVTRGYPYVERFGATVWNENTVDAEGTWTFSGQGIQELATNYFDVQLTPGTYNVGFADGGRDMQFVLIGVTSKGMADIIELGSGGAFTVADYDYVTLAVVNLAYDEDVEDCSYVSYSFDISASSGNGAAATYTLDASNFEPIGSQQ